MDVPWVAEGHIDWPKFERRLNITRTADGVTYTLLYNRCDDEGVEWPMGHTTVTVFSGDFKDITSSDTTR